MSTIYLPQDCTQTDLARAQRIITAARAKQNAGGVALDVAAHVFAEIRNERVLDKASVGTAHVIERKPDGSSVSFDPDNDDQGDDATWEVWSGGSADEMLAECPNPEAALKLVAALNASRTDYSLFSHDLPELLRILQREHLEVSGCLTDVLRALVHRFGSSSAGATRACFSTSMRMVVIESPYAGEVEANVVYAKRAVQDCLRRGESPYASHLFFTQEGLLDDVVPEERRRGIQAGFAWGACADAVVVYVDRGMSSGMKEGVARARAARQRVEFRSLEGGDVSVFEREVDR